MTPPRTGQGGYWALFRSEPRFLCFGVALTLFSGFGQTFFLSVFKEPWQRELGLSHAGFGLAYAVATGTAGFVLVWVGRFIDRADLRLWTATVVVGLALACLSLSLVASTVALTAALCAMRLCGQGLMGHTALTSMGRYFERRRGRAMSLTGLGFALGFALFPNTAVAALEHVSWREAWRLAALVVAVGVLPLALWLLRGHAARHARHLARARGDGGESPEAAEQRQWTRDEVVRDPRFWGILPLSLASPFLMTGLILLQEHVASAKGWSMAHMAGSLTVLGAAQYATAILIGPWVDRLGALRLVAFTQVPLALGLVVLALVDHPLGAPLYLGLSGVSMGTMAPVLGSVFPELYGVVHLGSIRALTSSCMVLSTALAPYLMGALVDAGVGVAGLAWTGVGYVGLATLAFLLARARGP